MEESSSYDHRALSWKRENDIETKVAGKILVISIGCEIIMDGSVLCGVFLLVMVPGVFPVGIIRWSISIKGSWSFSSRSRLSGVFPEDSWTGVCPVVLNSFSSA